MTILLWIFAGLGFFFTILLLLGLFESLFPDPNEWDD